MINWQLLIFNSIWIVGLSTWLAATSYHIWLAGENGRNLRGQLATGDFLRPFWFGLILIGLGLAGTARSIWELVLWVVVCIVAVVSLISLVRKG